MKQYRHHVYGYVETNTQISEFIQHLVWKIPKFTSFPKFWKMLEKLIMFIDKTLAFFCHKCGL